MSEGDQELIEKLEELAHFEGTEISDYWAALINLYRQSVIPDDLSRVLMEQIRQEVKFAEANAKIVTEEVTYTRKRLEWSEDL